MPSMVLVLMCVALYVLPLKGPSEPRAKSQEPRAKSQEPRTKNQEPVNICHPIAIQVPGFIDKGDITASLVPSSGRNATLTET